MYHEKKKDSHNSNILLYTGIVVFGLVWEKTTILESSLCHKL